MHVHRYARGRKWRNLIYDMDFHFNDLAYHTFLILPSSPTRPSWSFHRPRVSSKREESDVGSGTVLLSRRDHTSGFQPGQYGKTILRGNRLDRINGYHYSKNPTSSSKSLNMSLSVCIHVISRPSLEPEINESREWNVYIPIPGPSNSPNWFRYVDQS